MTCQRWVVWPSVLLALGLGGVVTTACHDSLPEGPSPVVEGLSEWAGFASLDLTPILTYLTAPDLMQPRHAERRISADSGGVVELGGVRLDVPPGALAQDTTITLDLPRDPTRALYVVADFGPDGLQFLKPVTVRFDLRGVDLLGVDLQWLRVSWWDGAAWRGLDSWTTLDGTALLGNTTHFTGFGAESPSGG